MKAKVLFFVAALSCSLVSVAQVKVDSAGDVSFGGNVVVGDENALSATLQDDGTMSFGNHYLSNSFFPNRKLLSGANIMHSFNTPFSTYSETFYVNANGSIYTAKGVIQSSPLSSNTRATLQTVPSSMDAISFLHGVIFSADGSVGNRSANIASDSVLMATYGATTAEIARQMQSEENRGRIGLVAQEVEAVLPEVVRTLPDGNKGIMYSDLIGVLVEGLKELKDSLAAQSVQIQELTNQLNGDANGAKAKQLSGENSSTAKAIEQGEPALYQNTPNPFNNTTEIAYRLTSDAQRAFISVYDLTGKELKQYSLQPNAITGKLQIASSDFQPGMYVYALVIDGAMIDSKRMILSR